MQTACRPNFLTRFKTVITATSSTKYECVYRKTKTKLTHNCAGPVELDCNEHELIYFIEFTTVTSFPQYTIVFLNNPV